MFSLYFKMQCSLCSDTLTCNSYLQPNTAKFECGCTFHLSCVIQYCKEKITNTCPTCHPKQNVFFANFGEDRLKAMAIQIEKRREINKMEKPKSYFNLFGGKTTLRSMIKSGTSLNSLKLNGYIPESFIEEGVRFHEVASTYTMAALINFGFCFSHMLTMGITPEHFKLMDENQMEELKISASDMLATSINIHQLAALGLSIPTLCQMKFTWADLRKIGGNCQTIRLLTPKISEVKTYFDPSETEYKEAGFTEEKMKKYKWEIDTQIFKKKKAKVKLGKIKLNSSNMLF